MRLFCKLKIRILEESWRLWTPIAKIGFWLNNVSFGKNIKVFGIVRIYNKEGKITVGNNVTINSASWANPTGFSTITTLRTIGKSKIIIGNNVGISNSHISAADEVIIGSNTLIGCGCNIMDTDFHPLLASERRDEGNTGGKSAVHIGQNCFLGAGVTVLKGVHIYNGSVIGAGAVLAHDVKEQEVWAGNPARKVRIL